MDRTYLGTYLVGQYAPLLAAAGLTAATDAITGYGPALDSVMRQLGLAVQSVSADPAIPMGQESDALLLTRYYALDWLLGAVGAVVDERTADQSTKGSQLFDQIAKLLERAKAQVPGQYSVEAGDFVLGRINLDYIEPELYPTLLYP